MDTKFQTSFIPKKPILMDQKTSGHSGGTSVFMFVSVIIFIISLGGAGFTFFWKDVLIKQQANYEKELGQAEKRFDVESIEQLKKANTKIDLANQLLKRHLAVSEIFDIMNRLTTEGIRFNSFDFTAPMVEGEGIKISVKGTGNSFSAIAWQSDVLGKSVKYGKNKVVKNPVISDLTLDDKGNVGFSLNAGFAVDDILYEKLLTPESIESSIDNINIPTE